MKTKHFLKNVEHKRVLQAIRAAEEGNTGDIVLLVTHEKVQDPVTAANLTFQKLNLQAAADKNSILILLAPETQKFAVVGGAMLHARVGHAWLHELTGLLSQYFKEGRYSDGLVAAIERIGTALKTHFPATGSVNRQGQRDIIEK